MTGARRPPGIAERARARWRQAWEARHPRSDQCRLTQRRVYILPTGAGCLFGALLLVLLLASINGQLDLGYALTFALAGIGLSSLYTTHATLLGLELQLHVGEPVYAGESAALRIELHGATSSDAGAGTALASRGAAWRSLLTRLSGAGSARARHGIGLSLLDAAPGTAPDATVWVDLPAGERITVQLARLLPHRGWHELPRVRIETRFPFGLFRAWSVWRPASRALAWPAPETPWPPWLAAPPGSAPPGGARPGADADDPGVLREWRRGDALTLIAWKKSAQTLAAGAGLITRERARASQQPRQLDWIQTAALPHPEARLARLCAWALAAEAQGQPWALGLPGHRLPLGQGPQHLREALHLLATWDAAGEPPVARP